MMSLSSRIAVFSPNLLELQSILSIPHSSPPIHSHVEIAARQFQTLLLNKSSGSQLPAIIVRVGELGAYTLSSSWTGWVPAFWTKADQSRIVDVTGRGNSFLGGLAAGLLISDGDIRTGKTGLKNHTEKSSLTPFISIYIRFNSCIVCHSTAWPAAPATIKRRRTVERRGCLGPIE